MIDINARNVSPAPKAKETTPANNSPKDELTSKENSTEFKDLVKEFSKSEKPKEVKAKVENLEEEKVQKPDENVQQIAVQMLMDIFSFTGADAQLVLDEITSTGNCDQLMAVMSMVGEDQKAQVMDLLNMLGAQQNVEMPENEVTDFAAKIVQLVEQNNNSTKSNASEVDYSVKSEEPKDIPHSQLHTVENSKGNTESHLTAQANFKSAVKQAKAMLGEEKQEGKNDAIDVDKLQQQAQSFKLAGGIKYVASTAETGMTEKELQNSIASQVKTGIVENLNNLKGVAKSEFVIKLRPEGLGEITVTMSQTGKDITLNIITQKAETQKLLNAEIMQLREALKPYNAQIDQVSAKTEVNYGSLSNGSEQFFGRNGSWQSGSNNHRYHGTWQGDGDGVEQDALYQETLDEFIYA